MQSLLPHWERKKIKIKEHAEDNERQREGGWGCKGSELQRLGLLAQNLPGLGRAVPGRGLLELGINRKRVLAQDTPAPSQIPDHWGRVPRS